MKAERSFSYANYILMCWTGVLLNCLLSILDGYLNLPLYLDCVGTVVYEPGRYSSMEEVLKEADRRMYENKLAMKAARTD